MTVSFSFDSSIPARAVVHNVSASSAEGGSGSGQGTLTIGRESALSLTATDASVVAGRSGAVTVEVANGGPSDADKTTVTGAVPAEAAVTDVSASQGSCTAGQSWTCAVGTLKPGKSATMTLTFSVDAATPARTIVHLVRALSSDGASADAEAEVVISAPPSPGAGFGDDADDGNITAVTRPGGPVTVSGTGFRAGSEVQVWLHSEPVLLGVARSDDSGRFTATYDIPSSTQPGRHHVVLEGIAANGAPATVRLVLDVGDATLPVTGAGASAGLGLLLAVAGLAARAAGRRT